MLGPTASTTICWNLLEATPGRPEQDRSTRARVCVFQREIQEDHRKTGHGPFCTHGFESRTPRQFPLEISASSWCPFFRLQNVSKSATSFSSSARGNVTELLTSDPVHPRAACFRHRLTLLWPGRVDA